MRRRTSCFRRVILQHFIFFLFSVVACLILTILSRRKIDRYKEDFLSVRSNDVSSKNCTDEYEFVISIVSNNRFIPLKRLVDSILMAYYGDISHNIHLVFNLEASSHLDIVKLAQETVWKQGKKTIRKRIQQGGLIRAVLESWFPASANEYGIILEDDTEVSQYFFLFLLEMLQKIECKKYNQAEGIVGISLYSPRLIETKYPKPEFDSAKYLLQYGIPEGQPYFFQTPCSWGALYFPEAWTFFHQFMLLHLQTPFNENTIQIPGSRTNGWSLSWKKFFFIYLWVSGSYLVYPNFPNQLSFSTNHLELGTHISDKQNEFFFKVPLLRKSRDYKLLKPQLDKDTPLLDIFGEKYLNLQSLEETFGRMQMEDVNGEVSESEPSMLVSGTDLLPDHCLIAHSQNFDGIFYKACLDSKLLLYIQEVTMKKSTEVNIWSLSENTSSFQENKIISLKLSSDCSLKLFSIKKLIKITDSQKLNSIHSYCILELLKSGVLVVRSLLNICQNPTNLWCSSEDVNRCSHPSSLCYKSKIDQSSCHWYNKNGSNFFNDSQFTTLMISFRKRFSLLLKQIELYSKFSIIQKIIVSWHHPSNPPRSAFINGKIVLFHGYRSDSLNNRFLPHSQISTRSVLLIDDDIIIQESDIRSLHRAWTSNSDKIVGFHPRFIDKRRDELGAIIHEYSFSSDDPSSSMSSALPHDGYSIMLTKSMMIDKKYLESYSCSTSSMNVLFQNAVDMFKNGEDLAMNFVVANTIADSENGHCVFVQPHYSILDFGKDENSLHRRGSHNRGRNLLLHLFSLTFHATKQKILHPTRFYLRNESNRLKRFVYQGMKRIHKDCSSASISSGCEIN